MDIAIHQEKIGRLDDLRTRLDPHEHFELWMWTSMNAVTQALNAALHRLGVTEPGHLYPHQIPGLYVEPEPVDGLWRKVMAAPGDVIHLGLPPIDKPIPPAITDASRWLQAIEDLRERHVRGDEPITEETIGICATAYKNSMAILMPLAAETGA